MNAMEMRKWIDSLSQDIDFEYNGKCGAICPFNRSNISLCYDGNEVTVHSVDEAMKEPFITGRSLSEISSQLII